MNNTKLLKFFQYADSAGSSHAPEKRKVDPKPNPTPSSPPQNQPNNESGFDLEAEFPNANYDEAEYTNYESDDYGSSNNDYIGIEFRQKLPILSIEICRKCKFLFWGYWKWGTATWILARIFAKKNC